MSMGILTCLRQQLSAWAIRLIQRFGPHRVTVLGRTFRINRHVFNPKAFLTSQFMARHLDGGKDTRCLSQKTAAIFSAALRPTDSVLDMGTGSGIQAVVAATTAARVVAIDINPEAVRLARENALANGVADKVTVLEGDLFAPLVASPLPSQGVWPSPSGGEEGEGPGSQSAVSPPASSPQPSPEGRGGPGPLPPGEERVREQFDVILFNPPYLEGQVRSLLDHAMFDPGRRLHRRFFAEAGAFLAPGGRVLLVCSSLAEPGRALAIADELGWGAELVRRKRILGETLYLYRLMPRGAVDDAADLSGAH